MIFKTAIFFLFLVLLFSIEGKTLAQESGKIQGTVVNSKTGEALAEVSIEIRGTTTGDVTDSRGFFEFKALEPGTHRLRASLIGFEKQEKKITIAAGETREVEFELTQSMVQLEDVRVEAEKLWEKYLTEASLVGVQRMKATEVQNIPGSLDDPTRAVQILSGVAGGGDYNGFIAVRGGSPDQNQVIIDGVEIPNPYRFRLAFGGGMSTINPHTTEDIYLHLGGFSAEYGNSMTSIMEVNTRAGDRDRIRTQGTLNFTDISGIIEGPTPLLNGSFLVSMRRTYYDLILKEVANSNSVYPFFFDLSSKLRFDLNSSNRIDINFTRITEGTKLLNEFSEDLNLEEEVSSNIASLNWRSLLGEKLQISTIISFYRDDMSYRAFSTDPQSSIQEYESVDATVTNFAFKENIRYQTGDETWFNFGFTTTSIPSDIRFNSADLALLYARIESPRDIVFDRKYTYYASYLEANTKASERIHLRVGARYDYSTLIDDGEISPRFNLWYKLDDRTKIDASWGVFYQYPNPLSIYTRNIPVDLGQSLDVISAEKSTHLILGFERELGDDFSAKLQLYSKDIDRLLLPENEITYRAVNNGQGKARGLEFLLQKKPGAGRFSGVLTYAYGKAIYKSFDSEDWLPFKYDRRHAITALLNTRLAGNWSFSVLGQFSTGLPFTEVIGAQISLNNDGSTRWDFLRGERFQSRFPNFKKVDARLMYQHKAGGKRFAFYLDVINLTNEQNVYEITWEKKFLPSEVQQGTKRKIYMLPLLPSFGVSFRF